MKPFSRRNINKINNFAKFEAISLSRNILGLNVYLVWNFSMYFDLITMMMNKKGKLKSERLTLDCVSPCRLCRKPFELQERPVYLWSSWFLTTQLTKTPFLTSECRYFTQENCQKSSPTWSNSHFHFTSFSETSTRCRWPWVTHWDSGLNWCLVWIDIEGFQCKMRKEA